MRRVAGDEAWRSVLALLDTAWPNVSSVIEIAARAGYSWRQRSSAFAAFEGGRAVAHAGVLPVPLVVAGRSVAAAGIHAVCAHPERRGRGLARAVLEAALAHADGVARTSLLFAVEPAIYERFGFRRVEEFEHELELPAAPPEPQPAAVRAPRGLSCDDPADRALLERCSRERAPVSLRLGAGPSAWLAALDELLAGRGAWRRLHDAPQLDCVVAAERIGDALVLHDVIGPELPELARVADLWSPRPTRVVLRFAPDRLAPQGARARLLRREDGHDQLMVRGPFDVEGERVAVPTLAHC